MDIASILKDHQAWLDKAKAGVASTSGSAPSTADQAVPLAAKHQMVDRLTARVATLSLQKDATIKQYDAAIAAANDQKAQLQKEIAADEKRHQTPPTPTPPVPTPPVPTRTAPSHAARAPTVPKKKGP